MATQFTAHDGLILPSVGFGTYQLNGVRGREALTRAIQNGYRLIDSAVNYQNEGMVGQAVRRSSVGREQLVVVSKLPGRAHWHDKAIETIEESLFRMGLDQIDLYLIHWPNPRIGKYVEAWQALIEARERGLVRSIGVCNFLPEHLERLERQTGVLPSVNQIELHPYFPQSEAVEYHRAHGIVTMAWSPLGRGRSLLQEPVITRIAAVHRATPAQVVLAWDNAREVLPIPKASSSARQMENLSSVKVQLSEREIEAITAMGRADGRLDGQDPMSYEEL
ncbi:Aldo/keto reductase [Propionibacterium cyclohexanicum]|uniref:Aldo/keto reductase n=1 Tax=Propionibacterium cyclohexanicum TaxID=64702 RepID=A0A1H9U154_9ACTN|nr:aldo/keto reductase [Propionibacterium cyclohexanicum]SES02941.1 Aldo/keto reductase [Propionibacterium cyclohexanicum]